MKRKKRSGWLSSNSLSGGERLLNILPVVGVWLICSCVKSYSHNLHRFNYSHSKHSWWRSGIIKPENALKLNMLTRLCLDYGLFDALFINCVYLSAAHSIVLTDGAYTYRFVFRESRVCSKYVCVCVYDTRFYILSITGQGNIQLHDRDTARPNHLQSRSLATRGNLTTTQHPASSSHIPHHE